MGFAFNPFTGNFDAKGSGGGGSSYIDGEVQNFSALPQTLGSPAVDSAYLVREAEGAWLLNRKPAGIYIRTANTGTRASDWTYAGEFPDVFNDANFVLYDNGDSTKNLQFQLSGINTATTRTLTAPNASGTIARTEDFAAPPAIGNTTPAAGSFTTLSASSTVSGTGFSNYLASPPAIGGTSAAAGSFTTLSASTSLTLGTSGILSGGTNTIEQRNTTSAQTFRIYNTVSGAAAANFERGFMRWSSNVFEIGNEAAGTGASRDLNLRAAAGLLFWTGGANRWSIGGVSGDIINVAGGHIRMGTGRLVLGSNTVSTVPCFIASGTTARVRLGDDSAFAPLECAGLTLNGNLTASTRNIVTDTTTGTKIGTGTTQKLGFYDATPVTQRAAIADATDAATTQARLNDLLAAMRSLGLIAT